MAVEERKHTDSEFRSRPLILNKTVNTMVGMKLTLQAQLLPDAEDAAKLKTTVERFNEAAAWLAGVAFERKLGQQVRASEALLCRASGSVWTVRLDMAIRCIAQVVEAYKRDKDKRPKFRKHAADARSISG